MSGILLGPDGLPIKSSPSEKRNYAYSGGAFLQIPQAQWSDWTISNAVREGMRASSWVYRSVSIIRSAASLAPFVVADKASGDLLSAHPISLVLARPNEQMSRKRIFSLLYAWLQLAGTAYLLKSTMAGRLQLWPVSPDRIAPIQSKTQDQLITGYAARDGGGMDQRNVFAPEEIIPILLDDPSNPSLGIGPLQAAAKLVDADTAQVQWNFSAMKNRGVLDGFVSFDQELDEEQVRAVEERLRDKYAGPDSARRMGVFGAAAKYTRIGLNAAEMDFIESRKALRDEELAVFGVPSQLANAQDASTYNNLRVSELMLWRNTIIPLLDVLADALTFDFQVHGEGQYVLRDDQEIIADTSQIAALQQDIAERADAGRNLSSIGVPVSQINRILRLGLQEFPGWDQPRPTAIGAVPAPEPRALPCWRLVQYRALKSEFARRERETKKLADKIYSPLLRAQQARIFAILEVEGMQAARARIDDILRASEDKWGAAIQGHYLVVGATEGADVVVESRAAKSVLREAIREALAAESIVLQEISAINTYTSARVIEQITSAIALGTSIGDLQQAIEDVGAFTPDRALRIGRTITGAAANLGQNIAAIEGGATHKTWSTSGFEVRSVHAAREGEEVEIADEFTRVASSNGVYPRYPGDPRLAPEDRINCRCVLTFVAKGK